jgi:hypothetical protein
VASGGGATELYVRLTLGFAVVEQLLPPLYVFLSALIFEHLLVFPTGGLTASVIGKEKEAILRRINTMENIVLLGDGTLDNRKISSPDPDVISHLRLLLPIEWKATLCAVDESTRGSVNRCGKDQAAASFSFLIATPSANFTPA